MRARVEKVDVLGWNKSQVQTQHQPYRESYLERKKEIFQMITAEFFYIEVTSIAHFL